MNTIEGPTGSVQPLKLSEEQRNKLRKYLTDELEQTIKDREPIMEKCKDWAAQANSRRKRKDARPRDSQIDMPLTRERMSQHSARLQNPIFQQETVFVAKPRNPVIEDMAREMERAMDYISDQIDYMGLTDDWIEQFQTFPCGVVKTHWVTKSKRIKRWREIDLDEFEEGGQVTRRVLGQDAKYFKEDEAEVVEKQGCFPEVVPFEDFLVTPISAVDVESADIVWHRIWLTKNQLKHRIREKVYEEKDGETKVLDALGDPSVKREKLLKIASDDKKNESEPSSKQYEIFEAYLSWSKDKKEPPVEIIVTMERDSGLILRAVYNFYHNYNRPFVTATYKSVQGSIYGIPMTYILEPVHVAYSASFNQRLDAASLANEKLIIIPPQSDLKQVIGRDDIRTGLYEATIDKGEIHEFTYSQPFTQLPELEDKLEMRADKLTALSDYSFGQEQIERPTATGQVQLIEESKQPQYMMLERFRARLALVCKHVLSRYQQFFPEGLFYYIEQEGPEGMQLLEQFFMWPERAIEDDVIIETRVSSATMSKQLRKQELVAMVDKMPQLYETMMGLAQAALQPQNPAALVAFRLLEGFREAVDKMFTEFEVGKKDILNPPLMKEIQIGQQFKQQIDQLMSQVQSMGGQLQKLQMENAQLQGGPPPGPPMAGPPMPPQGVQGSMPMGGPPAGPQPV